MGDVGTECREGELLLPRVCLAELTSGVNPDYGVPVGGQGLPELQVPGLTGGAR